ncbi:MAG TPA: hypothetical protein VFW33_05270 [Gemmataceae bacterium]|nr:hypothetical protein [Gemmataceae bacterium]
MGAAPGSDRTYPGGFLRAPGSDRIYTGQVIGYYDDLLNGSHPVLDVAPRSDWYYVGGPRRVIAYAADFTPLYSSPP